MTYDLWEIAITCSIIAWAVEWNYQNGRLKCFEIFKACVYTSSHFYRKYALLRVYVSLLTQLIGPTSLWKLGRKHSPVTGYNSSHFYSPCPIFVFEMTFWLVRSNTSGVVDFIAELFVESSPTPTLGH